MEIKTVKTNTFEMEYFSFGTGSKPLVIIPGVSLNPLMPQAQNVANAYAAFCEDYTCYCFDRKKDIQPGYDVSAMADDTAAAMEILGIKGAYILGCSQGGMLAQYIAIRHPELVEKMLLASTLAKQNDMSKKTFDLWYDLSVEGDAEKLNTAVSKAVYNKDFFNANIAAFKALEKQITKADISRFKTLIKACRTFDAYAEIDKIKCPVTVISSKADNVLSHTGAVEIAEKLGCDIYLYEGYSHAVYDMAPDFKKRMAEFFKR